jgi:hypothetical protein
LQTVLHFIDPRSIADQIPQRLPELQEAAEALEYELLVPLTLDAKVEICFATCSLSQKGQATSSTAVALRTSSSKGDPHSWQTNSNIGIHCSLKIKAGNIYWHSLKTPMLFIKFRCKSVKKVTNSP